MNLMWLAHDPGGFHPSPPHCCLMILCWQLGRWTLSLSLSVSLLSFKTFIVKPPNTSQAGALLVLQLSTSRVKEENDMYTWGVYFWKYHYFYFYILGFKESILKCGSASFSMFLQWIGEQASRTFFAIFLVTQGFGLTFYLNSLFWATSF